MLDQPVPAPVIDSPLFNSHLEFKSAQMAEWCRKHPEPLTPDQKAAKLTFLEAMYGPGDGAVIELKAELGGVLGAVKRP